VTRLRFIFPLRPLVGALLLGLLLGPSAALAARTHTVKRGETLSSIAARYGVSVEYIVHANGLRDADSVLRGQRLVIPEDPGAGWTGSHTVSAGETLSSIAALHRVSVDDLALANRLRNADILRRGQTLRVPAIAPAAKPAPAPEPPVATTPANVPAEVHTVRRGESLSSIAARYGVTVRDLAAANRIRVSDTIKIGQKLLVPQGAPAFIEHSVDRGESLVSIASRYQVDVADIRAANPLDDPNLIKPGQILRIPASDTTAAVAPAPPPTRTTSDPQRRLPAAIRAAIDSARVEKGRWKNIIIHHSGTDVGSGTGMDRYHREERRMENGLAYHFVVGNGNGMTDGSIFVGRRWNEQLAGGHVVSPELNHNSIGICLVGDFEKRPPTRRQMQTLEALVRALLARADLDHTAVTTHRLVHPRHTLCPGRHFPTEHFRALLRSK
jgi:LysM repeat protein